VLIILFLVGNNPHNITTFSLSLNLSESACVSLISVYLSSCLSISLSLFLSVCLISNYLSLSPTHISSLFPSLRIFLSHTPISLHIHFILIFYYSMLPFFLWFNLSLSCPLCFLQPLSPHWSTSSMTKRVIIIRSKPEQKIFLR